MDKRKGLQQRYTLETIIELHKGKPAIQGLNYDALAMLRNPLYVKMGQELKSESQAQTQRILEQNDQANNIRKLSSNNDLPHDLMSDVISQDDNMGDKNDIPDKNTYTGPSDPPPPPDSNSSMAPNSSLFRSNIEIQAELHALKAEMQKQDRHDNVIREVRQNITNTNIQPIKEITREIHSVIHQPPPPPPPQPSPIIINPTTHVHNNPQVIQALQMALMRNQNLEQIASQMGLSLQQIAQLLAQKKQQARRSCS